MNKIKSLSLKMSIFAYVLLPNIVFADNSGYSEYDMFTRWFGSSTDADVDPEVLIIKIALFVYNLFYIASIGMFGFKMVEAVKIYNERAVRPSDKVQAFHEILEPFKGMIFFMIFATLIEVFANVLIPNIAF